MFGLFSNYGSGQYEFYSIYGEKVNIYGKGLYQHNSVSMVTQGKAQDFVTLFLGIPLLFISYYLSNKKLLKGKLLLIGTLGYFLYTYMSYVFLWMFNPMFIIYVVIMSESLFAFILVIMSIDLKNLKQYFNIKLPVKFLGYFQIIFAVSLAILWIGKIIPILKSSIPIGLEHYTTFVIQGMDLGFIVPTAILSGILLIKRHSYGFLLSSIIIIKGVTMSVAITSMIIGQFIAGISMSLVEIIMFPVANIIIIYCAFLLINNIKEYR
jgi:hypothetical protein